MGVKSDILTPIQGSSSVTMIQNTAGWLSLHPSHSPTKSSKVTWHFMTFLPSPPPPPPFLFLNHSYLFYVLVTAIDSPPTHFLIPPPLSVLESQAFVYVLVSVIDSAPTHLLIFHPHLYIPPHLFALLSCFPCHRAHISCPAVFCNHH